MNIEETTNTTETVAQQTITTQDNSIDLLSINQLLNHKFLIPDYQRGYRWTDKQVTELLDDIWEFSQKEKVKDEFYCLQPVVVTKRGELYELIDGQQRLTTIFIILSFLEKKRFELEFETRKKSKQFLQNLSYGKNDKNIDFYYISEAYNVISDWFKEKEEKDLEGTVREEFSIALGKQTKVIWYEVKNTSNFKVKDIFTRLNSGKIPLTNAELIKALFLSKDNFQADSSIQLKQYEIAGEWDRIEYALQDNEFWFFLNNTSPASASRIEFLFDMIAGKKEKDDELHTFLYFNDLFNGVQGELKEKKIKEEWSIVKEYFLTFEEWYNNRQLHHLIGYLIATGYKKIAEIKELSDGKQKSTFVDSLNKLISDQVNFDISELNYDENYGAITNVLLLFNIITELNNTESNSRFPFNRYKGNGDKKFKWSLEHIHAQHSEGLTTNAQWVSWLNAHKESLERIDVVKYASLILEIVENIPIVNDGIFKMVSAKVLQAFREEQQEDKMHGIHNMALLDKDSNSALNASIFEIKRNIIMQREIKGAFIPIATRNVFLKYYSPKAKDLFFWSKEDRENYFKAIKRILINYLPQNNNSN